MEVTTPTGVTESSQADATPVTPSEAPKVETTAEAINKSLKKFKVYGKEVEVDLADEAKRDMLISKGLASAQAWEDAKKTKAEADEAMSLIEQKRFVDALTKKGMTRQEAKDALLDHLAQLEAEDAEDPQARQARLDKEELEARRKAEKDAENEKRTKKEQEEHEREIAQLEENVLNAIGASTKLPRHPLIGRLVAQEMHAAALNEIEIDPATAVKMVEREFPKLFKPAISAMEVHQLKEFLGEEVLAKLREDAVSAVKSAEAPFVKAARQPTEQVPSEPQAQRKVKRSEFFKQFHWTNHKD